MDLGCNHNYCQQGEDERSQAAREDLLETMRSIRGDERADLPIAVAKEPPELVSHPVQRAHCWLIAGYSGRKSQLLGPNLPHPKSARHCCRSARYTTLSSGTIRIRS